MTKAEHLGGDRWRVRVAVGGRSLDGKYRQLSRTFRADGQRAADRQARKIAAALDNELEAGRERRATLNGVIDDWELIPRAESTKYRNRSIVARIRKDLGHHRLEKLGTRDIDLWYAKLAADGMTDTTIHHYHRVLHSMLMLAERWDKVPLAPTRKSSPPKRNDPDPKPPRTDVLVRVIADATPGVQLAALLAGRLGLRRGEVCGLRWGDAEDGHITVRRSLTDVPGRGVEVKETKTKRERTLAMDDLTVSMLAAVYPAGVSPDAYIVASPTDPTGLTPRSPGWLSQAWVRLCRKHGVKIRFHDLRHWSASNMIDAGVPIKTVSKRLGHSLTSTTLNIYTGELPGADEAAAAALAARLPDPSNSVATE